MIDLEAIEERCEVARREINRLCRNINKWTMSIPVREDDSDIILTNSLRDVPVLVDAVKRLKREVLLLRGELQRAEISLESISSFAVNLCDAKS